MHKLQLNIVYISYFTVKTFADGVFTTLFYSR